PKVAPPNHREDRVPSAAVRFRCRASAKKVFQSGVFVPFAPLQTDAGLFPVNESVFRFLYFDTARTPLQTKILLPLSSRKARFYCVEAANLFVRFHIAVERFHFPFAWFETPLPKRAIFWSPQLL